MVVALGPGKFYGSSLPRPRFYTDVKFSDYRIDPPTPVMDPLMQWANEAHWSMGGLSTKRLHLQGKIEGNVEKLRKERESFIKNRDESSSPVGKSNTGGGKMDIEDGDLDDSPPPAPISRKRRRFTMVSDDEEEEAERVKEKAKEAGEGDVNEVKRGGKVNARRLARKLKDDFDLVADKGAKGKRSPLKEVVNQEAVVGSRGRRTRRSYETEGEEVADFEVSTPQKGGKRAREGDSASRKGSLKKSNGVQSTSASPNAARKSPRLTKTQS